MNRLPKLFVSHSSRDKAEIVIPLTEALERLGHSCWIDQTDIGPGESIPALISKGIQEADVFLVVLTNNYAESSWCQRELYAIQYNVISQRKRIFFVRDEGSQLVPELFADQNHILYRRADAPQSLARKIADALSVTPVVVAAGREVELCVEKLLEAEARQAFGANLINLAPPGPVAPLSLGNEGLVLIKPGGTFYRDCLLEIFRRLLTKCRIKQLRLYDGRRIASRKLFERLYFKQAAFANGSLPLEDDDRLKIRAIYDVPEFQQYFGMPYRDDLVTPAMSLCGKRKLDPDTVTLAWEEGRRPNLWHNNRWDGLNKIGYQRSVFPVRLRIDGREEVRILLNGYIPGLRRLFTEPSARVVAIHVTTDENWPVIRGQLAGEESDPRACTPGSIRHDAHRGIIPLDPAYLAATTEPVNGQRNVCHASATGLDAFQELIDWFECQPADTVLGKLLRVSKVSPREFLNRNKRAWAEWSRDSRDENAPALPDELMGQLIREDLRGQVSPARYFRALGSAQGVSEQRLKRIRGAEDFVQNWQRLETAGDAYFLRRLGDVIANGDAEIERSFAEVSRNLRESRTENADRGVLAAAYQIAAGDLLWMQLAAFRGVASTNTVPTDRSTCAYPALFRAQLLSELPEQAWDCAMRIRGNLLTDAHATESGTRRADCALLRQNSAWSDFLSKSAPVSVPSGGVIGLVVCGGRSTRMVSTIPKAILPLRGRFLFDWARTKIEQATKTAEIFAAAGFRSGLLKLAIADRARLLSFAGLHGVGFRVAACLHSLRQFRGLVVMIYCDMPDISSETIKRLIARVQGGERRFGIAVSHTHRLSGHVIVQNEKIVSVVQQRLHPNEVPRAGLKDVGVYVFPNTEEFRACLLEIDNDNVRGEYMFADVVDQLARRGWEICAEEEQETNIQTANTSGEFLRLTAWSGFGNVRVTQCTSALEEGLGLKVEPTVSLEHLNADFENHVGPVMLYQRWNRQWR